MPVFLRAFTVVLALPALTLLIACGSNPGSADDSTAVGESSPGRFSQTVDGLKVELQVDPYPPLPMKQASFVLTITDSQSLPVQGATVFCDMSMPAMPMPPNRPQALEGRPGAYSADILFTMAGEWQTDVQVALQDGSTHTFTFAMKTR
jgi:hypothetical protein